MSETASPSPRPSPPPTTGAVAPEIPSHNLPPVTYRDLPEPLPLWKVLGPGVVLAATGIGSGEFVLWPFVAHRTGLGFMWAALFGSVLMFFIATECARYTLATGETIITGFTRLGIPFPVLAGAVAFAGTGGVGVLFVSNYIRDKNLGTGRYIPRIVSPITGREEPGSNLGFFFPQTEENLRRWRGWWRVANWDQFLTFFLLPCSPSSSCLRSPTPRCSGRRSVRGSTSSAPRGRCWPTGSARG